MGNIAQQVTLRRQSPVTKLLSVLDKRTLILVVTLLALLITRGVADADYFWHLKTGEYIATNGALPNGDIFSYVRLGQEWVLHEWLFEVLLYGVHAAGGALAVMLMTASLGLLAIVIVWRSAFKVSGDLAASYIAAAVAFIPFAASLTPRPQLISYCLAAYYLSVLIDFKYCKTNVSLLWMPIAMIVWVNSHGGFLIGVAFLFAFTGCEWVRAWAAGAYADTGDRARLARLTQVCALTLAATLVNPDFIWHWAYPLMVLNMKANAVILEWQSPNFHVPGADQLFLLLAVLFVLAYIYASRKRDVTETLIPGLFILSGFISVRHIALASIVAVPFLALALRDGILARLGGWWRVRAARFLDRIPGARTELGAREWVLNWIVLLLLLTGLIALAPSIERRKERALEREYPVKAVDYILANGIKGRMYNDYNQGGYLIYRLAPRFKVMIDGRADVYGDEFINDYRHISSGRQGWREKLAKLDVDFAVTSVDAPIRQLMIHVEGFREVYADQHFSVLLRERPASVGSPD